SHRSPLALRPRHARLYFAAMHNKGHPMLSKNQAKNIRALHRKKERREQGLFLVEGEKIVAELLASNWRIEALYATSEFIAAYQTRLLPQNIDAVPCRAQTLASVCTLSSNNAALAVVQQAPAHIKTDASWVLALDNINDPGNLGSLLRIADWYGIQQLVCSPNTVELYNPKVINASKGSFLRVAVQQQALPEYFASLPADKPIYGAYLDGESIHRISPSKTSGVVLLGSEAHGISPELAAFVTHKITIPAFGAAESLNVGVAAAVICDNLRRLTS